ncbi:hypothetical protein ASG89_21175 [Paenibacillus sp. Soil766]|uniref:hypothetical protein n=1 Tax=Paenibacillus sp. Soil766 TaxID=1736404 RepID=UPI00070F3D6D|nr:hypothetical protein [Paenibacillus sp. Soil766]KRF04816.1 hypothetical protein ASG89_21175 [Paenibacillus sp. Soil766]
MRAWTALFLKDFRITRSIFFIGLVMNALIVMLTLYLGMIANDSLLIFLPLVAAVIFHVLYMPITLLISLKTEANQLHLLLHNPRPASILMLSKLVNSLIMIVCSLLMLYLMSGLLIIPKFSLIESYWTDTWNSGILIALHTILISIVFGVWIILLWTLFHFLKNKIGRWSWFLLIAAVVVPSWINALFENTPLYQVLTKWGGITYYFPSFNISPIQTYAGEYVYSFLIIIGLFALTAWIIDNKVEV